MTWFFIGIGIICVGAIIAFYNHVEKLKRIIEERQEDLVAAKAAAERKESKMLVSFSKQTSELRQKLEDATTDLQITKAQWEWMSKEKSALATERDQWKEKAEQAMAEHDELKVFQSHATAEIAQLKAALDAVKTEKTEWKEKYHSESEQWHQQKKELVNQLRPAGGISAKATSAHSSNLYDVGDILLTGEGMVLGERSTIHPDQLTNALIYEGETQISPLLERTRRESDLYPAMYQPGDGVSVLIPFPIQPIALQGMTAVLREALLEALSHKPDIQLLDAVALPIRNRTYGYVPSIALYVEPLHLYVDIEVDTPYTDNEGQRVHGRNGADHLRNLYFLENGWVVFRFAARQVAQHVDKLVALILQQLAVLTDRADLDQEVDLADVWLPRAAYVEAEFLSTHSSLTLSAFQGMKPAIDILKDHTARCQNMLEKVKGHLYAKVTLYNDYEYVFVADSAQLCTEGFERGWAVSDVIEQKRVFIPFAEIVAVSFLDSLWLSQEIVIGEEISMAEWDQLGKALKEAAYGARPVHLQYLSNEGTVLDQDVLYLSHYFTQNETGEIVPWEQTAPLLFEESYLQADFQDFAGYASTMQEMRSYTAYQIRRLCLYNCHKPGSGYNETDLWTCLQAGKLDIARQLYAIFHEEKRKQVAELSEQSDYKEAFACMLNQRHE